MTTEQKKIMTLFLVQLQIMLFSEQLQIMTLFLVQLRDDQWSLTTEQKQIIWQRKFIEVNKRRLRGGIYLVHVQLTSILIYIYIFTFSGDFNTGIRLHHLLDSCRFGQKNIIDLRSLNQVADHYWCIKRKAYFCKVFSFKFWEVFPLTFWR